VDVLLDEQETEVQAAMAAFLRAESTPALVRLAEKDPARYAKPLWDRFAALGWLGLCLPEASGGQGLPIPFLGLLMEEAGRTLAPLPLHGTLVTAMVLARHGTPAQRALLTQVASGGLVLSYAVHEQAGRWSADAVGLTGRREGDTIVLSGSKYFVDHFRASGRCLVAFRGEDDQTGAVLVDPRTRGIRCEDLSPTAKDAEAVVHFDGVRVPAADLVGDGPAAVDTLMDLASVLLAAQMEGAARRTMELAVAYVNQREAFGQPIGAFQAIQHMAADMVNAVDGTQLLVREAIWRIGEGLPARVEVSQAKSFANEQCLKVCRGAQQMHGGIGFIAEFDLQLWYRRVTSWSLRGGTTHEHRRRIASALLDTPGSVQLGMTLELPSSSTITVHPRGLP